MFSKFKGDVKTLFLDKESDSFSVDLEVNIILSPTLYWIKKISLPLKNAREVNPLLESLFEDTLAEGSYNYSVYKDEDMFFLFAYQDKVILDLLVEKNINISQVKNIYFMQDILEKNAQDIKINAQEFVRYEDDILCVLPSSWSNDIIDLDLGDIQLPKHKIHLKQFSYKLNNSILYTIGGAFILILFMSIVEFFMYQSKLSTTLHKEENIFSSQGLKATVFQNEALINEYEVMHTRQMKVRELTAYLLSLKLKKNEKIISMELKSNRFIVKFNKLDNTQEIGRKFKNIGTNIFEVKL